VLSVGVFNLSAYLLLIVNAHLQNIVNRWAWPRPVKGSTQNGEEHYFATETTRREQGQDTMLRCCS
jgi:hypothetical protein